MDTKNVNKDRIRLWVDALRSGKYTQGKYSLQYDSPFDEDKICFCCLGVACKIAVEEGLSIDVKKCGDIGYSYDGDFTGMPSSVKSWYGLDDNIRRDIIVFDENNDKRSIIGMNDKGLTFEEISDNIERTFLVD